MGCGTSPLPSGVVHGHLFPLSSTRYERGHQKTPDLDERELSVSNQAHYSAYQVLTVVLTTVTTAPLAASPYFGVDLPLRITHWHFTALYLLFMDLSITLPASVVAWTEPDPEPEGF